MSARVRSSREPSSSSHGAAWDDLPSEMWAAIVAWCGRADVPRLGAVSSWLRPFALVRARDYWRDVRRATDMVYDLWHTDGLPGKAPCKCASCFKSLFPAWECDEGIPAHPRGHYSICDDCEAVLAERDPDRQLWPRRRVDDTTAWVWTRNDCGLPWQFLPSRIVERFRVPASLLCHVGSGVHASLPDTASGLALEKERSRMRYARGVYSFVDIPLSWVTTMRAWVPFGEYMVEYDRDDPFSHYRRVRTDAGWQTEVPRCDVYRFHVVCCDADDHRMWGAVALVKRYASGSSTTWVGVADSIEDLCLRYRRRGADYSGDDLLTWSCRYHVRGARRFM